MKEKTQLEKLTDAFVEVRDITRNLNNKMITIQNDIDKMRGELADHKAKTFHLYGLEKALANIEGKNLILSAMVESILENKIDARLKTPKTALESANKINTEEPHRFW